MAFDDFINEGVVRKGSVDKALARSLVKCAESDLIFLSDLKIDENSARKIIAGYYDVLRSLVEAVATLEGYKVYSHEAFTDFLVEKKEPIIAQKFDRFRKIRNSINYYAKSINIKEAEDLAIEIKSAIEMIKKRFLNNF